MQHRAVLEAAAQHPHQAELAAMAAMEGLENLHHRIAAVGVMPARAAAAATSGTSWRSALSSRRTPLSPSAEPISTGTTRPSRQFARQIAEHFLARRFDIAQQFFHQMLVIIGQLFQHLEAGFLFAGIVGDIDHLAGGVGAIGKGPLQRQIDKAGGDALFPDRNLAQQQRRFAGLLQQRQQRAQRARAPCRIC